MSGQSQFNIAMIFRADVAGAKTGVGEVTTSMDTLSAATTKATGVTRQQAAELESLTQAAAKAVGAQDQLVAAEKRAGEARARAMVAPLANPAGSVAPLQAAYKATETSVASLQQATAGFTVTLGSQGREMLEQAAATRTYQAALDDVRASFNPLFAASRQYEQQLERIADAERIGAINVREAAAARTAAAERLTPTRPGQQRGISSAYTSNIGAQGFDIGVTAAMGMDPLMIGLQQGSQLAGIAQQMGGGASAAKAMAQGLLSIVNPTSIVTIGLVALGAAGIQWLTSLSGKTKTFDENLEGLNGTLDRMKSNMERVRNVRLSETFGDMTDDVRRLSEGMVELDRVSELKNLKDTFKSFLSKKIDPSWWQAGGIGFEKDPDSGFFGALMSRTDSAERQRVEQQSANYAALGAGNTFEDFSARRDKIFGLAETGDVKSVTQELLALKEAMSDGKGASGMSDELRTLLGQLMLAGIKTAEFEAMFNGTARAEAQKRQTDEMVRGFQQETEIAAAEAQFGADSIQVVQIRGRQASDMLELRLQELEITKDSALWEETHNALVERQAQLLEAVVEAGRERVRDQQDAFAATQLEISLIGASNAERQRANALAAAEIEIRKRKLTGLDAEMERVRAIQKAEADAERDKRQALYDTNVGSVLDGYDNRIADERDPTRRAAIEGEREYMRVLLEGAGAQAAAAAADRVRAKALADVTREQKKAMEGVVARAAGDAFDARIAAELNPYVRAQIEGEKEYAAQIANNASEQVAAGEAARVRARALSELGQSQADYLRGQAEGLQQSQLELALVGQTEAVRTRVLALAKAEREIARLGLTGDQAELVRRNTVAQVEMSREIEAQADAWKRVQSAGESAIDGVLDKLRGGDIGGAFEDLIGEIEKGFFDLAVRNPLKNALFGTNLGTLGDVGGLQGIWAQLSGKRPVDEAALVSRATSSVQSMTVSAMNLTLTGPGVSSLLSANGAANMAGAPLGSGVGGLTGSADVQSQVWSFFAARGLQPHQIAAIMGNASGESGFDPFARGDYQNGSPTSFGLFQHHGPRGQGLLNAVGGQSGLGDVNAQLEYVWKELQTSENGALNKLLASTNVNEATNAWMRGFERPSDDAMAKSWPKRLGAAEAALAKFQNTTTTTAQGLGTLGTGFDVFGNALAQGLSGAANGGGSGGFLSALLGGLAGAIGIPGFANGGDFWGGLRVVGENGPELEATGASRIWTASQTRDILTSRSVPSAANSNASVIQLQPVLVNNTSRQMAMEVEETTDARGQKQQRFIMSDLVAEGIATPGGKGAKTMKSTYGMTRVGRHRA